MKILRLPALMLIAILATVSVSEAAQKIGYIDSETLSEKLPEFSDIQRQLERLQVFFNASLGTVEKSVEAIDDVFGVIEQGK